MRWNTGAPYEVLVGSVSDARVADGETIAIPFAL